MSSRLVRTGAPLLLCACVCGVWIAGCSKKTTAPKPAAEQVNTYMPNANARITSQTIFGDADKRTYLGYLQRADDASLVFQGSYNDQWGVGTFNAGGSLRWFQAGAFGTRNVGALAGTALVPDGLVVVGGHDTNDDGDYDVGFASLYSPTGTLLSDVPVTSDSSEVWFYKFASVADSTFIACGGERRSGVEHPLLVLLHLRAPGVLERGRTVTLQGITGFFSDIVTLPSPPGELSFAAISRGGTSSGFGGTGTIVGLRAPWPGFDPVALEWSHEIIPTTGPWTLFQNLEQAGGNLYMTGIVEDHRKPAPSNGGSWQSGLAASFTGSGVLRWVTTDSLTRYDDDLYGLVIGPDAVYAVGLAAYYIGRSDPVKAFGYGLIAKLDLDTGHVIANFTLGQDRYQSGFYTVAWSAGGLICGGWTQQELYGGPPRGWLATVDVSGTTVAGEMPTLAAARRGVSDPDAVPELGRTWDHELR